MTVGNYNPHLPYILGQEFVPIQDAPIVLDINQQYVEYGYSFSVPSQTTVDRAAFFMPRSTQVPGPLASIYSNMNIQVNIYPGNGPFKLGPIRSIVVPCSNVATSGSGMTIINNGVRVTHQSSSATRTAQLFFDFLPYAFLNGKRILNVDLLYKGSVLDLDSAGRPVTFTNPNLLVGSGLTSILYRGTTPPTNFTVGYTGANKYSQTGALILSTSVNNSAAAPEAGGNEVQRFNLGGVYPYQPLTDPLFPVFPWIYSDLLRLHSTLASGRDNVEINFVLPTTSATDQNSYPSITLNTPALLITYCEETRIAQGTGVFLAIAGTNQIRMSTVQGRTNNPVLPAGPYWATITSLALGDRDFGLGGQASPPISAQRELFGISSHESIKISYPNIGSNVTVIDELEPVVTTGTHILPQISFHVTGSTSIPQTTQSFSQVYGMQAPGQVYGDFTVVQDIYDAPVGILQDWPFIRFYARRFGSTTVPLKATIGSSNAYLTPSDFDALDQITTDNWREVTLELDTPFSMGSGSIPQVTWSASGERAGNRWEVLGATAPAITGIPSTYVGILSGATYGAPVSGSVIDMTWLPQFGPMVSGMIPDQISDAAVIFSQLPPPVTGLTATWLSQEVTGIGSNCGIDPCCIPSEIYYTQLTWDPTIFGLLDQFDDRELTDSWGDPSFGPTYTPLLNATALDVTGELGLITQPSSGSSAEGAIATISSSSVDVEAIISNVTGGAVTTGIYGRYIDSTNFYFGAIEVNSATSITLAIYKTVAGVTTSLASADVTTSSYMTMGIGSAVQMRFLVDQHILKLKIWAPGAAEPTMWSLETTDTSLSATGDAVVFARSLSGSPITVGVSYLEVTPPKYWFGSYEIQRRDSIETEWQTIMRATNPAVSTFNDFEARPGITNEYRIRRLNVYSFWSEWSPEVSGYIPSPGVQGGCLTPGHLLIFTTNEIQNGSSNLAYSSVWMDRQVEEAFAFPEASFVQMQAMYDRDFYVAFRPLERGGEQFQRTVLVQAAAIAPETLGDFTSLRNMAWANVNYVCVRDEDGNRWFAHVGVPSGNVLRNRKLYLAPVQITEVTATPTPVDPSPWS